MKLSKPRAQINISLNAAEAKEVERILEERQIPAAVFARQALRAELARERAHAASTPADQAVTADS